MPENAPNALQHTTAMPMPSVDQLVAQVQSGTPLDQAMGSQAPNGQGPAYHDAPANAIDVGAFLKAQNEFIQAQTKFLMDRNTPEYGMVVTAYSQAQNAFIQAQAKVLAQLGII